jgi:hypothetical protein
MKPWFYKTNQQRGDDLCFGDLDLSFLNRLPDSAYLLINCFIDQAPTVPNGRDLYIFSWLFEPFIDTWFLGVYQQNPQAEFIIITDLDPNDLVKLPRVKYFYCNPHTTWITAIRQQNPGPIQSPLRERRYKISSLSSRLSEYKFFITAKLLDSSSVDVLYSWNRGFEIRNIDNWVFKPSGYFQLDELLKHSEYLRDNKVNAEDFTNNPLSNSGFQHPAYTNSIINSINETQNISETPDFGVLPTACITEKTWKPLFAGNALLFAGQAAIKKKLERWGFKFDYPWAQGYDGNYRDNQRLEIILNNVNWILELSHDTLAELSQYNVNVNTELAWSGRLETLFKQENDECCNKLMQHLGL